MMFWRLGASIFVVVVVIVIVIIIVVVVVITVVVVAVVVAATIVVAWLSHPIKVLAHGFRIWFNFDQTHLQT